MELDPLIVASFRADPSSVDGVSLTLDWVCFLPVKSQFPSMPSRVEACRAIAISRLPVAIPHAPTLPEF
jgi:hypothetical protein